jgi:hypothetical protein
MKEEVFKDQPQGKRQVLQELTLKKGESESVLEKGKEGVRGKSVCV